MNGGRENIPNTGIVLSRRLGLHQVKKPVGIAYGKLLKAGDAQYCEIGARSRANVSQALEYVGAS